MKPIKINYNKFVELFYGQKLTYKEIAKTFNTTPGAVSSYRRDRKLPPRGVIVHGMLGKTHSPEIRAKISHAIKGKQAKENNPNWKGGRYTDTTGCIKIRVEDDHPYSDNGYVREHRYLMEKHLGRYLEPYEIIHHINGDNSDNRIENLFLTSRPGHAKIHFPNGPNFGNKYK